MVQWSTNFRRFRNWKVTAIQNSKVKLWWLTFEKMDASWRYRTPLVAANLNDEKECIFGGEGWGYFFLGHYRRLNNEDSRTSSWKGSFRPWNVNIWNPKTEVWFRWCSFLKGVIFRFLVSFRGSLLHRMKTTFPWLRDYQMWKKNRDVTPKIGRRCVQVSQNMLSVFIHSSPSPRKW